MMMVSQKEMVSKMGNSFLVPLFSLESSLSKLERDRLFVERVHGIDGAVSIMHAVLVP